MIVITLLSTLETAGLVELARDMPELEYLFRHALVQNAAYATLVKADRQRLHQAVAEIVEANSANRLDELAGILAYHFSRAGEPEKAIQYCRRAARRATETYAYPEAIGHLQAALALLSPAGNAEMRAVLLEELADVHRLTRDTLRAIELYQEALGLRPELSGGGRRTAVRIPRKVIEALAEAKHAVAAEHFRATHRVRVDMLDSLRAGLAEALAKPPEPATVRLLAALATDAWRNQHPSDWDGAHAYAEQAVATAETLGSPGELTRALAVLAAVLDGRGQLRQHLQVCLRRLDIALVSEFADAHERLDALRAAGMALMYVGRYAEGLGHLAQAEALASRVQSPDQQFNVAALQGQCQFRLDRWDAVLATEQKWREILRRYGLFRTGPT
jgi:tetratricopeptide (TPR) repeat protein